MQPRPFFAGTWMHFMSETSFAGWAFVDFYAALK